MIDWVTQEVCDWKNVLMCCVITLLGYGVAEFEVGGYLKKFGESCYCHFLCKGRIGRDTYVNVSKLIIATVVPVCGEKRIFTIMFSHDDRYIGNACTVSR